jgi:hypothetical protein
MTTDEDEILSPEYLAGLRNMTEEEHAALLGVQLEAIRKGVPLPSLAASLATSYFGLCGFPFLF